MAFEKEFTVLRKTNQYTSMLTSSLHNMK